MNFLRGSLYIGAIRETKIFVHWTFFLLIAWVFISAYREHGDLGQGIISVLFVLVFFACITLHEFGHITVARRYGCYSKKITLLPIGGVASMDKIPEKPLQEMLMALAGPWVNFVIAAFIWLFLWISKGLPSSAVITTLTRDNFLYVLMTANLVVAFFNLIPAFPMDGGRVLRAILAMRFPRERATKIAANVAQVIAVVFVITGLFVNVWLTFIGVFVFLGATSEATAEMTKSLLSHYHVRNVLMHRFTCLSPEEDLESAARKMLDGSEQSFVVTENGNVTGILTQKELVHGLSQDGKHTRVADVMRRDFLSLAPQMHLEDAMQKMLAAGQYLCPVMENGRLAGVIDLQNINEFILINGAIRKKEITGSGVSDE